MIPTKNFGPGAAQVTITTTPGAATASQSLNQRNPANPNSGSLLPTLRIVNETTGTIMAQWGSGSQTATVNSTAILAGEDLTFDSQGGDNISIYQPSATNSINNVAGKVYAQLGEGS